MGVVEVDVVVVGVVEVVVVGVVVVGVVVDVVVVVVVGFVVVVVVAVVVVDLAGVIVVVAAGVTVDSFLVTLNPVGSVPLPDWLTTVTNRDPTAAPLAMTIFAVI